MVVANIVAIPAALWLMNNWLSHFAFRIELSATPFVLAFAVCLVFTTISLAYHVFGSDDFKSGWGAEAKRLIYSFPSTNIPASISSPTSKRKMRERRS
jgi:hypothetical protein